MGVYMEEKKNPSVKCMERSRLLTEQLRDCLLHETKYRLHFCPFFHFLTVYPFTLISIYYYPPHPQHENSTKILFMGQNSSQISQQEHGAAVWLASMPHLSVDIFLLIGLKFKPSGLQVVFCGFCLVKALLRGLMVLGVCSRLRPGGNHKLPELGKGNWCLWALHAGPLLGKWVLLCHLQSRMPLYLEISLQT